MKIILFHPCFTAVVKGASCGKNICAFLYPSTPVNIINAGVSGVSAGHGLARLERDVLRYNPDLVGVSFGLNDACDEREESLERYKEDLKEIFEKIKNSDSEAILMTANMMNTYIAPSIKETPFKDIADAYLNAELGTGYEWWHNFYEFHKLSIDELEAFDYEEYKKNGFKVNKLGDYPLKLETKPE